jgi:NADH pyrophosphatase NudC (nudix superfamily)
MSERIATIPELLSAMSSTTNQKVILTVKVVPNSPVFGVSDSPLFGISIKDEQGREYATIRQLRHNYDLFHAVHSIGTTFAEANEKTEDFCPDCGFDATNISDEVKATYKFCPMCAAPTTLNE